MAECIPSPRDWVREQVELYERSGGTEGTTLRDTGLPVIIVTHTGNKTGAIRKTPLMRVKDDAHGQGVGQRGRASELRETPIIKGSVLCLQQNAYQASARESVTMGTTRPSGMTR
jgi:hypothetical protein